MKGTRGKDSEIHAVKRKQEKIGELPGLLRGLSEVFIGRRGYLDTLSIE